MSRAMTAAEATNRELKDQVQGLRAQLKGDYAVTADELKDYEEGNDYHKVVILGMALDFTRVWVKTSERAFKDLAVKLKTAEEATAQWKKRPGRRGRTAAEAKLRVRGEKVVKQVALLEEQVGYWKVRSGKAQSQVKVKETGKVQAEVALEEAKKQVRELTVQDLVMKEGKETSQVGRERRMAIAERGQAVANMEEAKSELQALRQQGEIHSAKVAASVRLGKEDRRSANVDASVERQKVDHQRITGWRGLSTIRIGTWTRDADGQLRMKTSG